jgi:hypothetical protein
VLPFARVLYGARALVKRVACDQRAREGIFASVDSTRQRRSTISNGVSREARRHCYGRHYSDLSPTPCCSEGLLCHRSTRWLPELETGAARPELAVPQIRLCG